MKVSAAWLLGVTLIGCAGPRTSSPPGGGGTSSAGEDLSLFPALTLTQAQRIAHEAHNRSVAVAPPPPVQPPPGPHGALNLLPFLPRDEGNWTQGRCGNCWVWACTASASIMGELQGHPGPWSVQFLNSAYQGVDGAANACCGGLVEHFVKFYNDVGYFVPLRNGSAGFKDGGRTCAQDAAQPLAAIATGDRIPFVGMTQFRVGTLMWNQSRADAIAAIKAVLQARTPVLLTYFLTRAGWKAFNQWWLSTSENTVWTAFDQYRGLEAGHVVAVVGYDDGDGSWVCLNSWGATPQRPHGTFKIPQSLGYAPPDAHGGLLEFDYLNIDWFNAAVTFQVSPATPKVANGTPLTFTGACVTEDGRPLTYEWDFGDGTSASGPSATVIHTYPPSGSSPRAYQVALTVKVMNGFREPRVSLGKGLRTVTVDP